MALSIAVYGSSTGSLADVALKQSRELGAAIARRGHSLITGGCKGIPYEAVLGAAGHGGKVIGYSPWTSLDEHKRHGDPTEGFTEFVFVPKTYEHVDDERVCRKYRNISSSAACDACVIVSGMYGTLNEFTNAYDFLKPIGILAGTGGFADLLPDITKTIVKHPRPPIVVDDDVEQLLGVLEQSCHA